MNIICIIFLADFMIASKIESLILFTSLINIEMDQRVPNTYGPIPQEKKLNDFLEVSLTPNDPC
jgi:hypothetical protein